MTLIRRIKGRRDASPQLERAEAAIQDRRPKDAFNALFEAELVHHGVIGGEEGDEAEEKRLMGLWRRFGAILPRRV